MTEGQTARRRAVLRAVIAAAFGKPDLADAECAQCGMALSRCYRRTFEDKAVACCADCDHIEPLINTLTDRLDREETP